MINKDLRAVEAMELYGLNKNEEGSKPLMSPFAENKVYFATCSPRKNKIMKKRHYNVSPDGVSSLDEYTNMTTIMYETNTPGRRMSITISDGNSSEISGEPIVMAESLETSSLMTQSTNCSRTTSSPLPSPSSSCRSMATTASCNAYKYQFLLHLFIVTKLFRALSLSLSISWQATQWNQSTRRRIARRVFVRRLAKRATTLSRHKRTSRSTYTEDGMQSTSPAIPATE
jgi:hypothetical protein